MWVITQDGNNLFEFFGFSREAGSEGHLITGLRIDGTKFIVYRSVGKEKCDQAFNRLSEAVSKASPMLDLSNTADEKFISSEKPI